MAIVYQRPTDVETLVKKSVSFFDAISGFAGSLTPDGHKDSAGRPNAGGRGDGCKRKPITGGGNGV